MVELLAKGKRVDGRSQDEMRALKIETRLIEKANGSAKVSLGNTQVIAGVKVATGTPFADTPDKGVLMVNAEVLPLSSAYAEAGPPDENAIELARVVDRGVRESEMVDLAKLVLIAAKSVYTVFVDVNILNVDGNVFDATSDAVVSALRTAKSRKFEADAQEDGSGARAQSQVRLYREEAILPRVQDTQDRPRVPLLRESEAEEVCLGHLGLLGVRVYGGGRRLRYRPGKDGVTR